MDYNNNEKNNNTVYKPVYKCAICGKTYDNIADRIKCETTCLKKQQEEAKKAAEAKKKADKDVRKKEVDEAIKHAAKLLEDYMKDYGKFEYESDDNRDKSTLDYFWPSKLWHFFM